MLAFTSLSGLFVVSLSGALLPIVLARRFGKYAIFPIADSFAAGILCSAAFIHLLPDATEELQPLNIKYPVAGALAVFGAIGVHLLDVCSTSTSTNHTSYVLASALTVHALLEGLALGAGALKQHTFIAIFAAILLHKAFAAMSLGAALSSSSLSKRSYFIIAVVFAAVTPLSALSALLLVRNILVPSHARFVSASLTAVSAGVFAYVALAELLQNRAHATTSLSNLPSSSSPSSSSSSHNYDSIHINRGHESIPLTNNYAKLNTHSTPNASTNRMNQPSESLRATVFVAAAIIMAILGLWT